MQLIKVLALFMTSANTAKVNIYIPLSLFLELAKLHKET